MPSVRYSVHPSVQYIQNVIEGMKEKTGRSINEWIRVANKNGPQDEKARAAWLKREHGLGTNYASWIASRSLGGGAEDGDSAAYLNAAPAMVDAMYSGKKAALRPIHDTLIRMTRGMGMDVRICPCATIVPLYRNHVFAQIKPATQKRIDYGLALKGVKDKVPNRLIETGGLAKGDRITHKIEVTDVDEIDDFVREWTRRAYELDV